MMFRSHRLEQAHVSSDITYIHGNAWILSRDERANPTWIEDDQAPKAGDVLYEFGLTLAIPLTLALIVNVCLWAAGIPSP